MLLTREQMQRLEERTFARGISADVLMEGVEMVLARYGKTLADFQR